MIDFQTKTTKTIVTGGPCTCSVERRVRYVLPPCPGLPNGEVSCRPQGTANWNEVRHHVLPPGVEVRIYVADLGVTP